MRSVAASHMEPVGKPNNHHVAFDRCLTRHKITPLSSKLSCRVCYVWFLCHKSFKCRLKCIFKNPLGGAGIQKSLRKSIIQACIHILKQIIQIMSNTMESRLETLKKKKKCSMTFTSSVTGLLFVTHQTEKMNQEFIFEVTGASSWELASSAPHRNKLWKQQDYLV